MTQFLQPIKQHTRGSRLIAIPDARDIELGWKRRLTFLSLFTLVIGILVCLLQSRGVTQDTNVDAGDQLPLHEIIVSLTDKQGTLQLFRIREDGSSKRQITDDRNGCRMPAWSPDGKRIVYVKQSEKGMDLWLADADGQNAKPLTSTGRNIIPSWMPDSKHVVWTVFTPGKEPTRDSQIHLLDTETLQSRQLFSDPEQTRFSNSMPVVSPDGKLIAFVSNRSNSFRIWVSNLDGSDARLVSPPANESHEELQLPFEQKVPCWSPDGKWIAHWEGVEMNHLSNFTGVHDPARDSMIKETWNVWVVGRDGMDKRKIGRGDDPTWSPDGYVTRAFPDPAKGGPIVMIERSTGALELPIIPDQTPGFGRFSWKPRQAQPFADANQLLTQNKPADSRYEPQESKESAVGLSDTKAQEEYYRLAEVQTIRLRVAEEDLQRLVAALPERIYVPATFQWRDITASNVSIRFKGNSSSQPNQQHKRSFLIKFNEYDEDARFFGLRRVSFDNGVQFGSLFSEPIITEILRDQGIKTHRSNYARIFLNDQYQGVYVNVERIDESFIESHLPDAGGALFKVDEGGPGCNLQFLGDDSSLYKKTFEAQSESAKQSHDKLVEFIRMINHAEASEFAKTLETKMELDDFLRVTAIMLFSGAFDQLTGWGPHNYYLYHDTNRDRWRYLPWDLDVGFCENAFGRTAVLADWHAAWPVAPSGRPNPLMERIVADPALLKRYRETARTILDKNFEPEHLCAIIDANYELIKEDLRFDPFPHQRITVPDDRGYDNIVDSIKTFVRKRYALAVEQLDNPGPQPKVNHHSADGLPPQLAEKIKRIEQLARQKQSDGHDISPIHKLIQTVPPLMQQGKVDEAGKVFDEVLKMLNEF